MASDITADTLLKLLSACGGLDKPSVAPRAQSKPARRGGRPRAAPEVRKARRHAARQRHAEKQRAGSVVQTTIFLSEADVATLRRLGALTGDISEHGAPVRALRRLLAMLALW